MVCLGQVFTFSVWRCHSTQQAEAIAAGAAAAVAVASTMLHALLALYF
jgi:hypothetical protein